MHNHLFDWFSTFLDASPDETEHTDTDIRDETEVFQSLCRVDKCAGLLDDFWPRETGEASPFEDLSELNRCGRFEIQNLIGRGGMGNVFRAFDPTLGRIVALKIPHPGLLLDQHARERFTREARAAALLRHPNIVRVLESADPGPICFIAFEYCEGPTLSDWIGQQDDVLDIETATRICIDLAEAVQHAHDRGVVHRDLKPSNILMEDASRQFDRHEDTATHRLTKRIPSPRITDFGLARLDDSESVITRSGKAMGTAEYMSPEQSQGNVRQVGPLSDQFSLGVILYQLLTGINPFRRGNLVETLVAVQQSDPVDPSQQRPEIPSDMAAVCLKALSKRPGDRYASAGHFADDLQRCLDGYPTLARPVTWTEATGRWLHRHPALATSVLTFVTLLFVLAMVTWWSAHNVQSALNRTQDLLYAADMRLAGQAVDANSNHALGLLRRHIPKSKGDVDRRTFAWNYLWGLIHKDESVFRVPNGARVYSLASSSEGDVFVAGDSLGRVSIFDVHTCIPSKTFEAFQNSVEHVLFRNESTELVAIDEEGNIGIWDIATSKQVHHVATHEEVFGACMVPETGQIITAYKNGRITKWSKDLTEATVFLPIHPGARDAICTPNGRWIITAGAHDSIKLWDAETGQLIHEDFQHSRKVPGNGTMRLDTLACSDDSTRFAVGSQTGHVFVWDIANRKELAHFDAHTSNIYGLHFSPSGRELASASKDTSVRIWDLHTKRESGIIQGHGRPVYDVLFSPNGEHIITCSKDETVRVWDRLSNSYREETSYTGYHNPGRFTPTGGQMVQTNHAGKTFFIHGKERTRFLPGKHAFGQTRHRFSEDGRYLAIAGRHVTPSVDGRLPTPTSKPVHIVDLDGDGDRDRVTSFGNWGHLVWRENVGDRLLPPRLYIRQNNIQHIGRHQFAVGATADSSIETLCLADSAAIRVTTMSHAKNGNGYFEVTDKLVGPVCAQAIDLDIDGDADLVVADHHGNQIVWFESEGSTVFQHRHVITNLEAPCDIKVCDINADGHQDLVVLSTNDNSLLLLEGRAAATFAAPRVIATGLPFPAVLTIQDNPEDGFPKLLVSSDKEIVEFSNDHGVLSLHPQPIGDFGNWSQEPKSTLIVYDLVDDHFASRFSTYSESVRAFALSPDGSLVATSEHDRNIIRIWRAADGKLLRQFPPVMDADDVRKLAFTPNNKTLLFVAGDNCYAWDVGKHGRRRIFLGHDNTVRDVTVSSDGTMAATVSHDFSARVWDIDSGEQKFVLIGHQQQPHLSCFSPDGKSLATVGKKGEIVVWDLTTGQQVLTLLEFQCDKLSDVRFPNKNVLTIAGEVFDKVDGAGTRIGTWAAGNMNHASESAQIAP